MLNRPHRPTPRGTLALLLLIFVVATEAPVLHSHQGQGTGLYDEECPAGRLATSAGRLGPSPRPLTGIGTPLPGGGSPEAPRLLAFPGIPLGPTDARAPPLPA